MGFVCPRVCFCAVQLVQSALHLVATGRLPSPHTSPSLNEWSFDGPDNVDDDEVSMLAWVDYESLSPGKPLLSLNVRYPDGYAKSESVLIDSLENSRL